MGDLLEYLVPIIVGAVYLLSQFFSKGSQEEDPAPGQRPGRPDPEVLAREQEIRDQIRRKIQQRRQAADEPVAEQSSDSVVEAQRTLKPRELPDPVTVPRQPSASPVPAATYETLMEAQLSRIEATKAQAAALQKRVSQPRAPGESSSAPKRSLGELQSSLRKSLKNPRVARRAILYKEILEAPIALRTSAGR
jgi:hypothetical protein